MLWHFAVTWDGVGKGDVYEGSRGGRCCSGWCAHGDDMGWWEETVWLQLQWTQHSTKTASTAAGLTECWKVGDQVPEPSGMAGVAKILQNYACMHLNPACSVIWEFLYCIMQLLLSFLNVSWCFMTGIPFGAWTCEKL